MSVPPEVTSTILKIILMPVAIVALFWTIRVLYFRFHKTREQKGDTSTSLSPTLQWMNTAGSILLAWNKNNFRYMGGIFYPGAERDENLVANIKKMLWNYWGIQGHDSALEKMTSLIHTGMRRQYDWEMRQLEMMYAGYSERQLIEVAKQENPKASEDSFLPKMLVAYRRYGQDALLGWDVGRAAYNCQNCYFAGYLSMEEVLEIGVEGAKKAQAVFQNWEEMMESYLLGFQYWKREDAGDPDSVTAKRWELYEKLWRGEKPYEKIPYVTIAFDTHLSKKVITDQYGIMPAYQHYD